MIGPLDLGSEHSVTIDCRGQAFDYAGVNSRLTMGPGAVLRFQNCLLLDYDLSDSVNPPGSKHEVADSLFGFGNACAARSPLLPPGSSHLLLASQHLGGHLFQALSSLPPPGTATRAAQRCLSRCLNHDATLTSRV